MGIICEINVSRPSNEAFKPGDLVSGVIRYVAGKEIEVSYVNVYLKGTGNTVITYKNRRKDPKFFYDEEYINICKPIQSSGRLIAGERYEKRFEFRLPHNIPPSFQYSGSDLDYNIKSDIRYYLKIKFKRPEVFKTDKVFKKDITLGPYLKPTLLKETVTYESQYKFMGCQGRSNIIDLKVKVENSVIKPNGKLKYYHEISNYTCGEIESVKACLVERYTFKGRGQQKIITYKEIDWIDVPQSNPIDRRDNQFIYNEIDIPCDKYDIQHSTMISRDYYVQLKIILPAFREDRVFKFPVQIGDEFEDRTENCEVRAIGSHIEPPDYDPPPSYWEVMGENLKDISDDED